MPKRSKFILCENGSYLLVRNITRLFVQTDEIKRTGVIKASTVGPAMPFVVASYDNKLAAKVALQELVDRIEKGGD